MCPSPAAVRRYPNVTLALMVGRPAAAATPFAAEAVTSLFEQQNWKFRRQKTLSTAGRAASNLHSAPVPNTCFVHRWADLGLDPIGARRRRASGINQFLRRTAAIVSRAEEVSLPQHSAWRRRRGEHTRQGKARHGTARRATPLAGFRKTCLGGFLYGPAMHAASRDRALARDSSSL